MGALWAWIALSVSAPGPLHGALRDDLESASPGNLKVLLEFDAAAPLENSVQGRATIVELSETVEVQPGVDSTDTGLVRVPGYDGYIWVRHRMETGRTNTVNRYSILMDVSFDEWDHASWRETFTGVLCYNEAFCLGGQLWFNVIQNGVTLGAGDIGIAVVEMQEGVFYRLVMTGNLNSDGTSRVAVYVNGRRIIDASGESCHRCEAKGDWALGQWVEFLPGLEELAGPTRLTTLALWDTDLTEEAIIALGPPSIGAAESPQCAAMDVVGALLTRRPLPPLASAPGVATCGRACCRGEGPTPCREIEMRWKYNADTGACEQDLMKETCIATYPVNEANIYSYNEDPIIYFGISCSPLPSTALADEPVLALAAPNFGSKWILTSTISFFAAVKYFLAGRVIPVEKIHPTLRGVFPIALYLSEWVTADVGEELLGKMRDLMAHPDPEMVPVSKANLSRRGTFVYDTPDFDFEAWIRGPRRPPAPAVTVVPAWEEVCDAAGRAALSVYNSAHGFAVAGRCVPTTRDRAAELDVSGGFAARCEQWRLLFGELGVVKFGHLYQNGFKTKRFQYLDGFFASCFAGCSIQSDTLDSELNGTCLQDSVELCDDYEPSPTCLPYDAGLRRMKSGFVAGASHANDVRVLVFGMSGSVFGYAFRSLFDAMRAESVTGGKYQLLFYGSSPEAESHIYRMEIPGYSDVLHGAIVAIDSCDGQRWDDFAAFQAQLKPSDFPENRDLDGHLDWWGWGVEYSPSSPDFARLSDAPEDGGGVVDADLGSTVEATLASLVMMNSVLVDRGHSLHKVPLSLWQAVRSSISFPGVCGGTVSFDGAGQRPSAIKMKVYSIVPLPAGAEREGRIWAGPIEWRYEFVGSVTESAFARHRPTRFYNGSAEIVPHTPPYCEQGYEALDDLRCHRCRPGFYSNSRGRYMRCSLCEPGTFTAEQGSVVCSPCEAGSVAAAEGLTACELCAEGSHQPVPRRRACIPCGFGTFADVRGAERCTFCPRGFYQELEGRDRCDECDGGRDTPEVGTQSSKACHCPSGTYESRDASCAPCPSTGLVCPGGASPPLQAAGYKAVPGGRGNPPLRVVECRDELSCPEGLPMGTCPESRTGMACDRCHAGYAEVAGRQCQPCEERGFGAHLPLLFGIVAFLCLLLLMLAYGASESMATHSQSRFTVLTSVGLVLHALQAIAAFATFSIKWVEPVASLQRVLAVFTLDVFRLDCTLDPALEAVQYVLILISYPAFALLLQLCFFLFSRLHRRVPFEDQLNAQGTVLVLTYLPILMISLKPWHCSPNPDGTHSVKSMPDMQCWSPGSGHRSVAVFSLLSFLFICIGYIALASWGVLVYPSRVLRTDGALFIKRFRFLFRRFTVERYYYSLIHTIRNLAMALVPVAFTALPRLQLMLVLITVAITLCLQVSLLPWRTWACNILDGILSLNLLLIVSVGLMLGGKQADDGDLTAQVCLYLYLSCILIAALAMSGVYTTKVLFPRKRFGAFLCHHKAGAGSMARWLKILLGSKVVETVFLDSDNLHNLDTLFHMVANETWNLVVLLTRDILLRPWCAGEMATAVRVGINIIPVACGDFLGFTDDSINGAGSTFSGNEVTMLSTLGVTIPRIRDAYVHIQHIAPLRINRSDPYIVHEQLVDSIAERCKGLRRKPLSGRRRPQDEERLALTEVLILGGQHHEAVSTCHIIRMLLQSELQKPVDVLECAASEAITMAKSLTHVLVILSAGVLHDIQLARCLSLLGANAWVRAVRADDAFAFPDDQFWIDLASGLVFEAERVDLQAVTKVYREMFKVITTSFTPHGSSRVHGAEIRELIKRMNTEPATPHRDNTSAYRPCAEQESEEESEEEEAPVASMQGMGSLTGVMAPEASMQSMGSRTGVTALPGAIP